MIDHARIQFDLNPSEFERCNRPSNSEDLPVEMLIMPACHTDNTVKMT